MTDADLERRLAERPRVEPPADLGPRVLAAVRDVRDRRPAPAFDGWSWAALAAAVLLAVNLSMSVSADADWDFTNTPPERDVTELRKLAPDLPDAELRRQALLTRAAAGLTPAALPARTHRPEEPDRCDAR